MRSRSEPFELDGVWWYEGMTQAAAAGTLTFNPQTGLELSVLDTVEVPPPEVDSVDVIRGKLLGGADCVLRDCFVRHSNAQLFGGLRRQKLHCNELLVGTSAADGDPLAFTRATLAIDGLVEWLLEPVWACDGSATLLLDVEGGKSDEFRVELAGATVTLGAGWSHRRERFAQSDQIDAQAHVDTADAISIEEWIARYANPLTWLLVLFTGQPSELDALRVSRQVERAEQIHPAIRRGASDDYWDRDDVEWVAQRRRPVPVRPRLARIIVPGGSFADERERLGLVIQKWFRIIGRLGRASATFFGTINTQQTMLESRLFNFLTFAETYHRTFRDQPHLARDEHKQIVNTMVEQVPEPVRRHYRDRMSHLNEQTQKERVDELVERAAQAVPQIVAQTTLLARRLVSTRNYLTHFSKRDKHVLEGTELHHAVEHLQAVVYVNLLMDLEIPAGTIASGIRKRFGWTGLMGS